MEFTIEVEYKNQYVTFTVEDEDIDLNNEDEVEEKCQEIMDHFLSNVMIHVEPVVEPKRTVA